MKLQIIQLEPYDDIASVRDRLAFVKAERVLLVWPRHAAKPILNRKLDLVLIQREAMRRNTRLALVTTEPDILDLARELNISTFPTVRASSRGGWKKPRSKVFIDRTDRPEKAPDPYELMLHASRLRALSPQQRLFRRAARVTAIGALILTALVAIYLLVPGADVVLTPAQGQINTSLPLIADPNATQIDVEFGRIPATLRTLDIEAQASIPASGRADVPSAVATGSVLFTNRIESPVEIPAGTIVSTPGRRPARFETLESAVVAAGVGQTVQVNIRAEAPGTASNIEPDLIINIEGDLSRLLSVRNPEPTRGGTVREQAIVTQADTENLLVLARAELRQQALARFSALLTGTQTVVPDSIQIVNEGGEETTYNAFVGDPVDRLTLTMRARVQALIIDEQAARQTALARLSRQIPPGQRLILESVTYRRGPIAAADAQGRVTFLISASGNIAAYIDTERARQQIAGLPTEAALETLNRAWLLDPRRPPQIQLWPGLLGRLPALPVRINILINMEGS